MELASMDAAVYLFFLSLLFVAILVPMAYEYESRWLLIPVAIFALFPVALLVNALVWLARVAVGDLPEPANWGD